MLFCSPFHWWKFRNEIQNSKKEKNNKKRRINKKRRTKKVYKKDKNHKKNTKINKFIILINGPFFFFNRTYSDLGSRLILYAFIFFLPTFLTTATMDSTYSVLVNFVLCTLNFCWNYSAQLVYLYSSPHSSAYLYVCVWGIATNVYVHRKWMTSYACACVWVRVYARVYECVRGWILNENFPFVPWISYHLLTLQKIFLPKH